MQVESMAKTSHVDPFVFYFWGIEFIKPDLLNENKLLSFYETEFSNEFQKWKLSMEWQVYVFIYNIVLMI